MKSCFFMGHSDAPSSLYSAVLFESEKLIEDYGVSDFYVGQHGNFDSIALSAITSLKQQYPHIRRFVVTPYHPAEKSVKKPENCEELFYPFGEPVMPKYAIAKANRKMIESCDCLIVYAAHIGKARDFLEYARKRESKGYLRVFEVNELWEGYMIGMLASFINAVAIQEEGFSYEDIEDFQMDAFSNEESLLKHGQYEFGDSFERILRLIEKSVQREIAYFQEDPDEASHRKLSELLEFKKYFSQLRRRKNI